MGYRFVLRKFSYPDQVEPAGALRFTSWWDNKGVAPCYKPFRLALRLSRSQESEVILTNADITSWMPGDNLFDDTIFVPATMAPGVYRFDLAIVDENHNARIKLAIEGRRQDGWYSLGQIRVVQREWKAGGLSEGP